MISDKPDCERFVVETIRAIRPKVKNLKPNTAAGVALWKVWKLCREVFEETEFRTAMQSLLKSEEIICSYWDRTEFRRKLMREIPNEAPLAENLWRFDARGKLLTRVFSTEETAQTSYGAIRLHVKADGLPGIKGVANMQSLISQISAAAKEG